MGSVSGNIHQEIETTDDQWRKVMVIEDHPSAGYSRNRIITGNESCNPLATSTSWNHVPGGLFCETTSSQYSTTTDSRWCYAQLSLLYFYRVSSEICHSYKLTFIVNSQFQLDYYHLKVFAGNLLLCQKSLRILSHQMITFLMHGTQIGVSYFEPNNTE